MTNMRNKSAGHQRGFTLIELVVVIAIIGVLAAISAPLVTGYLGQAKERAYNNDVAQVQTAVDAYYSAPDDDKFTGKRQYPTYGMDKASSAPGDLADTDADILTAVTALHADSPKNPLGGSVGGSPTWVDDGDGIRDEEGLRATTSTAAGWYQVAVTRHDKTYYVDTRDYIIDMEELVDQDVLDGVPASAASDNCKTLTCTGSYIYYIGSDGKVKTLLATFPIATSTGFQSVHP